nr:methylated-DNA--[protein]-cysteine S-methyltransferase [Phytohalomonas tamaricis]
MHYATINSPLGEIVIRVEDDALSGVFFTGQRYFPLLPKAWRTTGNDHRLLDQAAEELNAFFAGERLSFTLPLAARGTPFQQRVWQALQDISYGECASYGDITRRLGLAPGAARAVGGAIGRNPLSIIVPCHRVVGSQGKLTGYAGGLTRKQALLALEQGEALPPSLVS